MRDRQSVEGLPQPWGASTPKEAVLDVLSLGITKSRREQTIRARYARQDAFRTQVSEPATEVTPRLMSELVPDGRTRELARLALEVVTAAKVVHIKTTQGYTATLVKGENGSRSASLGFGDQHEPTHYRVREATGRDYNQDLSSAGALIALTEHKIVSLGAKSIGTMNIEGIGHIANEYPDSTSRTGRSTDACFLIQGLRTDIAKSFIGSLREQPVETLDGVMYTAFADIDIPGRSLLQTQPEDSIEHGLFRSGSCNSVMVLSAPER